MAIFYVQYHAEPEPEAEAFRNSGGAYVNCWVKAASEAEARKIAIAAIRESNWKVFSVEDDCREVTEEYYSESEESLEYYRQAAVDGECYVYHQWPNEPQEEDVAR
jgi:hypothetical protein